MMNHHVRATLVVAGVVAGLAASAVPASAAPAAAQTQAAVASAPPPGFHLETDGTELITAAIPDGWNVLLSPIKHDDGTITPRLMAGPGEIVGTEWGAEIPPPVIDIRADPLSLALSMPSAPSCVGLQVVPYNDPFIVFAELAVDRGPIPVAITEPGDDTIDCEIVYEYGIAEDAQADVSYSVSYLTHIVGEPEPSDEQRQADWALFDVVLASLARPQLSWAHAMHNFEQLSGTSVTGPPPLPEPFTDGDTWTLWPFGSVYDVPQYGNEPVRGSGCGADGSIGEMIPNGLWAGYLYPGDSGRIEMDLACVYFGQTAKDVVAGGGKVVLEHGPDFVVVNNNPRTRALNDAGSVMFLTEVYDDHSCRVVDYHEYMYPGFGADLVAGVFAWVRVDNGNITWITYDCGSGANPIGGGEPIG